MCLLLFSPLKLAVAFLLSLNLIHVIIVLMLGGGFAILGNLIKKLDINKALKLGED